MISVKINRNDCSVYGYIRKSKSDILYKIGNTACFAAINRILIDNGARLQVSYQDKVLYLSDVKNHGADISNYYINIQKRPILDDKYVTRIVNLVNKITPCKVVSINNVRFIKLKLLDTYAKNLVVCNILRMLWYIPLNIKFEEYYVDIMKKRSKDVDPLSFILKAVIDNYDKKSTYGDGDHSLVYYNNKIKTIDQLHAYRGDTMHGFLII